MSYYLVFIQQQIDSNDAVIRCLIHFLGESTEELIKDYQVCVCILPLLKWQQLKYWDVWVVQFLTTMALLCVVFSRMFPRMSSNKTSKTV